MKGKALITNRLSIAVPLILIIALSIFSCTDTEPVWKKGNLHTHTFWSDGDEFPDKVVQWDKEKVYDFMAPHLQNQRK